MSINCFSVCPLIALYHIFYYQDSSCVIDNCLYHVWSICAPFGIVYCFHWDIYFHPSFCIMDTNYSVKSRFRLWNCTYCFCSNLSSGISRWRERGTMSFINWDTTQKNAPNICQAFGILNVCQMFVPNIRWKDCQMVAGENVWQFYSSHPLYLIPSFCQLWVLSIFYFLIYTL